MLAIRFAPAALMLAFAAPALAQQPTPFENAAMAVVAPCTNMKVDAETAAAAVTACTPVGQNMAALKDKTPGIAGHDLNVHHIVTSMALTRIGNAYSFQDGNRRTARVCVQMELAWKEVAQVDPAASPGYAAVIKQLRDSSINVIGKCRSENGTPAGAPPLPPQ